MPTKRPRINLTTDPITLDRIDRIIALKAKMGLDITRTQLIRAMLAETSFEYLREVEKEWADHIPTLESPAVPPMERCVQFSTGPEEIQTSEGPGFPGRVVAGNRDPRMVHQFNQPWYPTSQDIENLKAASKKTFGDLPDTFEVKALEKLQEIPQPKAVKVVSMTRQLVDGELEYGFELKVKEPKP